MMRRKLHAVGLALVLAGACACGAARPSKYYSLDFPSNAPAPAARINVDLLVGHFTAPHLLRDDRIVYRVGSTQLGTYEYHRWAEPPVDMVEALLVRSLRASGQYRSVQTLRSNARGDFMLRGRLQELGEVAGSPLAARVVMEFELYNQKTGATVWSQFYSHDEPVNGKQVSEVVEGLNRNLQKGIEQAVAGMSDYFSKNPPQP